MNQVLWQQKQLNAIILMFDMSERSDILKKVIFHMRLKAMESSNQMGRLQIDRTLTADELVYMRGYISGLFDMKYNK